MSDLGVNLDKPYAQQPEEGRTARQVPDEARCEVIEPTDEMVHLAVDKFLKHPELNNIGEIDTAMRETLAAVLALVERAQASELEEFRDKLAALAAIEDYIGESGQNAARNVRDLLAGKGDDNNDPRVQARVWGLEW